MAGPQKRTPAQISRDLRASNRRRAVAAGRLNGGPQPSRPGPRRTVLRQFGESVESWAALIVGAAALIVAVATLRHDQASEVASGPIVDVGAWHQVQIQQVVKVPGEATNYSETPPFLVMVLVNHGRSPVDVVGVQPLDAADRPLDGRVYFSSEGCERGGAVTLDPGAGMPVAVLTTNEDAVPYAWEVSVATSTQSLTLRQKALQDAGSSDPAGVAGAYDGVAEKMLRGCGAI